MGRAPPIRHRVVIADDHIIVAQGLALTLSRHFNIVGTVHTLAALAHAINDLRPDVVLLDVAFPEGSALPLLRRMVRDPAIRCRFVMLSGHESASLAAAALEAGAAAYLHKGTGEQELRLAIESAATQRVTPASSTRSHARARRGGPRCAVGGATLSRRQLAILLLMLDGRPRQQIADSLHLTLKGVDYNIHVIKDATGMPNLLRLSQWLHEYREQLQRAWHELGGGIPG